MEGTIQPAASRSPPKGSPGPSRGERQDAHPGLGLGPLAQHERAGEGVDVLDPHAGAVRHHLAPGRRVARAQLGVGGGEDAEVPGVVVGQHDEPAVAAGRRRQVVDGVLDALAARAMTTAGLGERVARGDGEPLGGVGAVQPDEHEGGVAGRAGRRARSAGRAPRRPARRRRGRCPAGGATAGRAAAPRPCGRRRRSRRRPTRRGRSRSRAPISAARRRGLGVEGPEAQLVLLVAAAVGRVGQPAMVVAHRRAADGEVLGALGQHVLVEQDLLLVAGLAGRGELVAPAGGAAAVDGVALPLLGARVVPPGPPAGRHRHVGLLDAGLHLLEEAAAEAASGAVSCSVYAFSASR